MTLEAAIEACGINVIEIIETAYIANTPMRDAAESIVRELETLILADRQLAAAGWDWLALVAGCGIGYFVMRTIRDVRRIWWDD